MAPTKKYKRRKRKSRGKAGNPWLKTQSKRGKTSYISKRTTKKLHSTTRLSQSRSKMGKQYNKIMKKQLHSLEEKKKAFDEFFYKKHEVDFENSKTSVGKLCINTRINPENRNLSLGDFKKRLSSCSFITILTMMFFLQSQLKRMDSKHYSNKENLKHKLRLEAEYRERISDLEKKIEDMKET